MGKYHAVFHLNDDDLGQIGMVLINIRNLLEDLGDENVTIELVVNGKGIHALLQKENPHEHHIARLSERGVTFAVCANSLQHGGISTDALLPGVQIVPSGVGELVKKQAEGWAYIKP